MDLSSCSYLQWQAVQEVMLTLRDIAEYIVPGNVTQMDVVLYENKKYKLTNSQNTIMLIDKITRNCFAGYECNSFEDHREYSTIYNHDNKWARTRIGDNRILSVNGRDWWKTVGPGVKPVYLPELIFGDDENELHGELFQNSLVYSTEEINLMIMNFILKDTLHDDTNFYFYSLTDIREIYDVSDDIEEIKRKCLPNLNK